MQETEVSDLPPVPDSGDLPPADPPTPAAPPSAVPASTHPASAVPASTHPPSAESASPISESAAAPSDRERDLASVDPPPTPAAGPPVVALAGPAVEPPPDLIAELADACVRFVEGAVGVKLDYHPETLPLLDHYLSSCRTALEERPEAVGLIARAAGAYFGEVARRRVEAWWHVPSEDPSTWELRARPVYLAFNPVAIAYDAISRGQGEGPAAHFQLDDADRAEVETRLAELPEVSDEEFYALATRLEVLDIAIEASKARMMRDGVGDVSFESADYED